MSLYHQPPFPYLKRQQRRAHRKGITLAEILVCMIMSSVIILSISTTLMTVYRTYGTESMQNYVNYCSRQYINSLKTDFKDADNVVWAGASSYTLPSGPSYAGGAYILATSKLIVLQVPSYNASGNINGSFDYIGYDWNSSTKRVTRTCVITVGSSRKFGSAPVAGGGLIASQFNLLLHDTTSGVASAPVDPFVTSVTLPNVDQVVMDIKVSTTSYGQSLSSRLITSVRLRNWHLSLS